MKKGNEKRLLVVLLSLAMVLSLANDLKIDSADAATSKPVLSVKKLSFLLRPIIRCLDLWKSVMIFRVRVTE